MTAKLTPFHKKFVAEILASNETPTAVMRRLRPALKRPHVTASKVLALPQVAEYRDRMVERMLADRGVTVQRVLSDLIDVKERCMQAVAVLDDEGKPTGQYQFKEQGALKALDMLGDYLRMWSKGGQKEGPIAISAGIVQVNIYTGDAAREMYAQRMRDQQQR